MAKSSEKPPISMDDTSEKLGTVVTAVKLMAGRNPACEKYVPCIEKAHVTSLGIGNKVKADTQGTTIQPITPVSVTTIGHFKATVADGRASTTPEAPEDQTTKKGFGQ